MTYTIRLHIEQEHACGQLIEEILHIESADFSIKASMPTLFPKHTERWEVPPPTKTMIAFTGTGEQFEGKGFALNAQLHRVCVKCGELIDPPKQEDSQQS